MKPIWVSDSGRGRTAGVILTDRLRVEVAGFTSSVGQVEVEKSEKSTVRSAAA